jgi:8-oxo-dGTP pyrophosphatase MutT (NUDIX family)
MEILSKTTKWEGSYIRIVLVTYRGRDGNEHTWEAVERIGVQGVVVIVPVTKTRELILIRQYRPALDGYVIELPARLVEPDEDYLDTCRRELIEETGHDSQELSLLTEGVMSTGITSDIWKVVLARNTYEAANELKERYPPDHNEDIEAIKVPLADVAAALEIYAQKGDYIDLRIH